jgi:hypothetical protein
MIKYKVDDIIENLKAGLMMKCYTQIYNLNL